MLGIFIMIGSSLLLAGFVMQPASERVNGSKRLQLLSGVSPLQYWLSNFLFDYTLSLLPTFVIFISLFATYDNMPSYAIMPLIFMLLLVPLASIPQRHLLASRSQDPTTAMGVLGVLFGSLSMSFLIAYLTVLMIGGLDTIPARVVRICAAIICPEFLIGHMIVMATDFAHVTTTLARIHGENAIYGADVFGTPVLIISISFVCYAFLLVVIAEAPIGCCKRIGAQCLRICGKSPYDAFLRSNGTGYDRFVERSREDSDVLEEHDKAKSAFQR